MQLKPKLYEIQMLPRDIRWSISLLKAEFDIVALVDFRFVLKEAFRVLAIFDETIHYSNYIAGDKFFMKTAIGLPLLVTHSVCHVTR